MLSEADCLITNDAIKTAPIATTSAEDLYKKDSCKFNCDETTITLRHAVLKQPENCKEHANTYRMLLVLFQFAILTARL